MASRLYCSSNGTPAGEGEKKRRKGQRETARRDWTWKRSLNEVRDHAAVLPVYSLLVLLSDVSVRFHSGRLRFSLEKDFIRYLKLIKFVSSSLKLHSKAVKYIPSLLSDFKVVRHSEESKELNCDNTFLSRCQRESTLWRFARAARYIRLWKYGSVCMRVHAFACTHANKYIRMSGESIGVCEENAKKSINHFASRRNREARTKKRLPIVYLYTREGERHRQSMKEVNSLEGNLFMTRDGNRLTRWGWMTMQMKEVRGLLVSYEPH